VGMEKNLRVVSSIIRVEINPGLGSPQYGRLSNGFCRLWQHFHCQSQAMIIPDVTLLGSLWMVGLLM
jgi:hypothetical protein